MKKIIKFMSVLTLFMFFGTNITSASEQVYFYYNDPAGTPLAISDMNATVVWRANYLPFGEEMIDLSTVQNNKMFVGKEKDSESGLYYFGARYMDPGAGRFTSVDPVGSVNAVTGKINSELLTNAQQLNRYAYALNNPYRYYDKDGKWVAQVIGFAIGAGFGAYSAINNNQSFSGVMLSAAVGGATGLLSTIPIPGINPLLSGVVMGGVAGFSGNVGAQLGFNSLNNLDTGINWDSAQASAMAGAFGGLVGGSIAGITNGTVIAGLNGGRMNIQIFSEFGQDVISSSTSGAVAGSLDAALQATYFPTESAAGQ
jgi:RHS repeat-associated protein